MRRTTRKFAAVAALAISAPLVAALALTAPRTPGPALAEPPPAPLTRVDPADETLARAAPALPVVPRADLHGEPQPLRFTPALAHVAPPASPAGAPSLGEFLFRVRGVVLREGEPVRRALVRAVDGPSPTHHFRCGGQRGQPGDPAHESVLGTLFGSRITTRTDDLGRFELSVEGHERLWIVAEPADGVAAEPVALRVDADREQLVIRAPASGGTLRGRVAGAGRGVVVHTPMGGSSLTDDEGRFTLRDVPPGETLVHACAYEHAFDAMPRLRRATPALDVRGLVVTEGSLEELVLDGVFERPPQRAWCGTALRGRSRERP